ncbi:hypothetical protein MIN45_P0125 [Methylomarinovum tepidoasis]|uniref:Uncharacterized protein n=1 Tax=Methylomarinovum tepidoasis TaxID=2840183 RepID=A0AAU9CBZ6_9GAMM|nr:hypothetical protein [Methylomarinovum sp. IN45]BCX87758.1 hypothetical protein MIN45_P0125 [Methylomarinovum sp. IN45]
MASIATLMHATVEFNLQIPANTATWLTLLALAWIVSNERDEKCSHRAQPPYSPDHTHDRSRMATTLALTAIGLCLALAFTALRWGTADLLTEIDEAALDESSPEQILPRQRLATRLDPANHHAWFTLARVHLYQADTTGQHSGPLASARKYSRQALRLAPSEAGNWLLQAATLAFQGQFGPDFSIALHRAFHHAPWKTKILLGIVHLGESSWPRLTQRDRRVVTEAALHALIRRRHRKGIAIPGGAMLLSQFCRTHRDEYAELAKACRKLKSSSSDPRPFSILRIPSTRPLDGFSGFTPHRALNY